MGKQFSGKRLNIKLAILGVVLAVLFIPPIFNNALAIGEVNAYDKRWLVPICVLLFFSAIVWFIFSEKIKRKLSIGYMVLLILISLEVLTRVGVLMFGSERDMMLLKERYTMTFDGNMGLEGNAFSQVKGKPNHLHYNNYGFVGEDFDRNKSDNIIRIACFGESTMTDGTPDYLETYLNANRTELKVRYETQCFAHDDYTSAHSLVTFLMTAIDFKPDYIVIHHGKSEAAIRNVQSGYFRGDYSHALKSWERSYIPDALLIRGSILYRHFRFVTHKRPNWWGKKAYIEQTRTEEFQKFQKIEELKPFRRNIEHMIGVAKMNNIKVVLTTLPHTTETYKPHYESIMPNVEQCNAIMREIAAKYTDDVIFIDLDNMMSGSNELYTTVVDVNEEGIKRKAELLGNPIIETSASTAEYIGTLDNNMCRRDLVAANQKAIHADDNWSKEIQRKADEKGITYNEMLLLDAIHIYRQDSIRFAGE